MSARRVSESAVAPVSPRQVSTGGLSGAMYVVPLVVVLLAIPSAVAPYQTILLTYGLVMAIAALAFNLLLGYTGLLSFGHAAYFGAAAYTAGFIVKYLHTVSMEAFLVGGMATGLVIAALFGFVCVRYTRIFFSILTLALSQVLWSLAFKFFWVTGGTDGIRVPTPLLLGGVFGTPDDKVAFLAYRYYYYVLIVFCLSVAAMWLLVNSPFGKSLQAIRDNEVRAEFVGVRVRRHRWIIFVVSGIFTGLAGALWAPLNGLTTPEVLYWPFSGEIVFMAVLGGFKTFAGPLVGAVAYNYLKTYAVGRTEYWQLLVGVVLVVMVLVMPEGILGTLARIARRIRGAH
jgi:branched-chain amino acid transport system permease protein